MNGEENLLEKNLAEELRILRHMRERNKISKNDYNRYIEILRRRHYMEIMGRAAPLSVYDLISRIFSFFSIIFVVIFIVVSIVNLLSKSHDNDSSKQRRYSNEGEIKENEQYLYTSQGRIGSKNPNYIPMALLPEEEIQTNRICDITVKLADLDMRIPLISELFGIHLQRCVCDGARHDACVKSNDITDLSLVTLKDKKNTIGDILRFRVFLRDERFFDAILIPGCPNIAYANSLTKINVQVRDIACFRSTPTNSVPSGRFSECLSDDEARELFHWVCAMAYETRFNLWDSVTAFLPDGFWNKYHPVLSSFELALIGLLYILWDMRSKNRDAKMLAKLKEKGKE